MPPSKATINMLWSSMFFAVILYVVVGWMVTKDAAPRAAEPMLLYVLSLLAAGTLAGALLYERATLDAKKLRECPSRRAAWLRLQTHTIIILAINETAAIFGLVWTFISGAFAPLPYFCGAAALALLLFRGRLNAVFDAVERGAWRE